MASPQVRHQVAAHEAAHAVVALVLWPGLSVVATIHGTTTVVGAAITGPRRIVLYVAGAVGEQLLSRDRPYLRPGRSLIHLSEGARDDLQQLDGVSGAEILHAEGLALQIIEKKLPLFEGIVEALMESPVWAHPASMAQAYWEQRRLQ